MFLRIYVGYSGFDIAETPYHHLGDMHEYIVAVPFVHFFAWEQAVHVQPIY